jgi:Tfp pilus assembly protein PilV
MFSCFKKSDGFSLVETMSSIVILTIAIFPALGYFTNSINLVHQTEIRSQAMDMAVDTMEYFKMTSKNESLDINTAVDNFANNGTNETNIINTYDQFIDDYNIEVSLTDNGALEKINVRVLWNDGSKNVELTSLVRDGG